MKPCSLTALVTLAWLLPLSVAAQEDNYRKNLREQFGRCTSRPAAEDRTYSIKDPFAVRAGRAQKPRSFLDRLLGRNRQSANRRYSEETLFILADRYNLKAPEAETKRSAAAARERDALIAENQNQGLEDFDAWLGKNPNANAKEVRKELDRVLLAGLYFAGRPSFDWRERGLSVGEVLNQGQECNSCWAFATVDAFKSSLLLQKMRLGLKTDATFAQAQPSVQELLNCVSEGGGCRGGWFGNAFDFMLKTGVPLERQPHYTGVKTACAAQQFWKALRWDYVSDKPNEIAPPDEIKRALVRHGPLVIHLVADDCFAFYEKGVYNEKPYQTNFNPDGTLKSIVPFTALPPEERKEPNPNHTVLLIGWDDDKQAWLVKNSWGTGWGEGGFAWIKYATGGIGKFVGWVDADPGLADGGAKPRAAQR